MLLALLVVALAIETFGAQSGAERLRSDALRTVLSVALWIVVFERPRERRIMAAVLFAFLAINWGRYFTAASLDRALWLAHEVLLVLLLWSAVYVILRDLFRAPAPGAESVLGAICGYVIAGNAWGQMNSIAYLLVPSAYSINPVQSIRVSNMVLLENGDEAAGRCLNEASALLRSESQDLRPSAPLTHQALLPGGLARSQATRALAYIEANSGPRSAVASWPICSPAARVTSLGRSSERSGVRLSPMWRADVSSVRRS